MNVSLKKGDASGGAARLAPGEWGRDENGLVFVRCPHETHEDKRPRIGVIAGTGTSRDWQIDASGRVSPSIFFNDSGCGWHVFATLEGWAP